MWISIASSFFESTNSIVELQNPYLEYKLYADTRPGGAVRMNEDVSYYPCIKYKIPADPKLDGTSSIFIAESMHFHDIELRESQTVCDSGHLKF